MPTPSTPLRYLGCTMAATLHALAMGPRTVRDIADHTHASPTSIPGAVRRLRDRGLIEIDGETLALSNAGISALSQGRR